MYQGWLSISEDTVTTNTTDYFLAGSVDTDAQIVANKFSDLATIASDKWVNPFLQFPLDNLLLQSPKI